MNATLDTVLAASAARFGATAFHYDGSPVVHTTVGDIHRVARRVAAGLTELGVRSGDAVAVQLPNRLEAAIVYDAALLAVLVPIVPIYGLREVEFIVRESGARVLVLPDSWGSVDYTERVARLTRTAGLEQVVMVAEQPVPVTIPWRALLDSVPMDAAVQRVPDDVCVLAYTSGTTSAPKGVRHTHRTVLAELAGQPAILGGRRGDVQLMSFPAGHVAGLLTLLRVLVHGVPTVVMDGWRPDRAVELINEHRVSFTAGTPFHLAALLDHAEAGAPLVALREFLVGGASVPAELVARADRAGITAFRCYGSTEHPTVSSGRAEDPLSKRQLTDGRPSPGTEIRIVGLDNSTATELPAGQDGEVLCRGPERFVGYQDPGLDAEVLLPDGWMRTGDIGHLDADGYLTITDRAKDVIIRGGETISSREIEDIMLICPGVADVAAIAVPDPRYGERVGVVVVLVPGAELDLAQVRAHFAATGTAPQKTPEHLELLRELPRTAVGKVRKAELRSRSRPLLCGGHERCRGTR